MVAHVIVLFLAFDLSYLIQWKLIYAELYTNVDFNTVRTAQNDSKHIFIALKSFIELEEF